MATSKTSNKAGRGLDLGALQNEVEQAARNLKAANTALNKATDAQALAEANHHAAQKAMQAGVAQLTAATKVL